MADAGVMETISAPNFFDISKASGLQESSGLPGPRANDRPGLRPSRGPPMPLPADESGVAELHYEERAAIPPANALFADADSSSQPQAVPVEERLRSLAALAERVRPCSRCAELCATRTQTVFGVGRIDPDLCFVGEAPGADEDARGEPFVGAAGQLLNKIIVACGLKREEVYICNILKCRPPGNRLPLPVEAANCAR